MVNSISPTSGFGLNSYQVIGSNFGSDAGVIHVTVGEEATVTNVTNADTIDIDVPAMAAGVYDVEVLIDGMGIAELSTTVQLTIEATAAAIDLSDISQAGGYVTITGDGLSDSCVVTFDALNCEVQSATVTELVCIVEGYSSDEDPKLLGLNCNGQ